jgi:hypothetical protein
LPTTPQRGLKAVHIEVGWAGTWKRERNVGEKREKTGRKVGVEKISPTQSRS